MFIASYPSIEDSDQQEKKAARAASGEMYVRVFVLFLRRALVEGVYGGGKWRIWLGSRRESRGSCEKMGGLGSGGT